MELDEDPDRPSFENFLSQPSTLTDHLLWQVGAMPAPKVRRAAELMIGNLNEDGYLTATEEELVEGIAGIRRRTRKRWRWSSRAAT